MISQPNQTNHYSATFKLSADCWDRVFSYCQESDCLRIEQVARDFLILTEQFWRRQAKANHQSYCWSENSGKLQIHKLNYFVSNKFEKLAFLLIQSVYCRKTFQEASKKCYGHSKALDFLIDYSLEKEGSIRYLLNFALYWINLKFRMSSCNWQNRRDYIGDTLLDTFICLKCKSIKPAIAEQRILQLIENKAPFAAFLALDWSLKNTIFTGGVQRKKIAVMAAEQGDLRAVNRFVVQIATSIPNTQNRHSSGEKESIWQLLKLEVEGFHYPVLFASLMSEYCQRGHNPEKTSYYRKIAIEKYGFNESRSSFSSGYEDCF